MRPQSPESAAQRIASAPTHYRSLIDNPEPRFAVVRGGRTVKEVLAYLPSNYQLMESFEVENAALSRKPDVVVIIGGYDNAGWTLDGYVIPRLASGSIACEEIEAEPFPGYDANVAAGLPPDADRLVAGTRVKLLRPVERFPHFLAPAGATGIVVDLGDPAIFAVRLDETLPGAEEWENEVHWMLEDEQPTSADLEVLA